MFDFSKFNWGKKPVTAAAALAAPTSPAALTGVFDVAVIGAGPGGAVMVSITPMHFHCKQVPALTVSSVVRTATAGNAAVREARPASSSDRPSHRQRLGAKLWSVA
jgi:hypothetical protein